MWNLKFKYIEAESSTVVPGLGGGGDEEMFFEGYKITVT